MPEVGSGLYCYCKMVVGCVVGYDLIDNVQYIYTEATV